MARALAKHVLEIAKSSGASVKAYEVAVRHLAEADELAGPQNDVTAIYGAVRAESGLLFANN